MSETEDEPAFLDTLLESNGEFQDGDFDMAVFTGPVGYHRYYSNDAAEDDLSVAYEAALHKAVDEAFEMLWLDEDTILEYHDEVTPETIAETFRRQAGDMVPHDVVGALADELRWTLADQQDALHEDGENQGSEGCER